MRLIEHAIDMEAQPVNSLVHEACVCGGLIVAASADPDDIRIAVVAHQDTMRHREWRAVELLQRKPRRRCLCKGESRG